MFFMQDCSNFHLRPVPNQLSRSTELGRVRDSQGGRDNWRRDHGRWNLGGHRHQIAKIKEDVMWPTTALVLFLALQSNYYELGVKALDEKRYQDAVDNFINAIAAEPKDYSLHFNLALAYSLMSKDAEA